MCTVKPRDGTLEVKVCANLRDIDGVSIVGRVSDVLRPRVSKLRSYATGWTQSERTQQAVITRRRARLAVCDGAEATERPSEVNTVRGIVSRAQSGVATCDSNGGRDDLRRCRRVDVDRPDQMIARRTRIA